MRRPARPHRPATALALLLLAGSCGGGSGGGGGGEPPANSPPSFSSPASVSVPENSGGVIYTAAADDPDGDALSFTISGGADSSALQIDNDGDLRFNSSPDFENPADADRDKVYEVEITANDGEATAALSLAITVTDGGADAFSVRRVGTGFDQPLYIAPVPDGSGRVFVVEKGGRIRILDPDTGGIAATPFLDISAQVSTNGERGLLGFATAPDFATSGVFYVYLTNAAGDSELRRYRTQAGNRDRADSSSADLILTIGQPASNHNGGWIGFGPDDMLYVALGDGGGSGDPTGQAQNANTLLGAILRLDVDGDDYPGDDERDYAIPADNPFANAPGADEIWAYGLRNPFRASFDSATGNLLIGDVGQNAIEEIDLMRSDDGGANFGWNLFEGTRSYAGSNSAGLTFPVAEYPHGSGPRQGNTVTGGYVYRGPVEALQGLYVFADFISDNVWTVPVADFVPGTTLDASAFTVRTGEFAPDAGAIDQIASFGVDEFENLYLVGLDGEIFRIEADGP